TDVYSLGAILYELLTGRPPFCAERPLDTLLLARDADPFPPRRLQPKIPRDLETICLKCLEKEPGKRYPSARALADELERFRQGLPITARPVGTLERAGKWARRHPAWALLGGVLLLLLAVGLPGLTTLWLTAARARSEATALADAEHAASERAREEKRKA